MPKAKNKHPKSYADLLEAIKARKDELGLSNADLARETGTIPSKVSEYLRGEAMIRSDTIQRWLEVLKLKIVAPPV